MKKSKSLRQGLMGLGITIAIYVLLKLNDVDMHLEYYLLPWILYLIHWAVSTIIELSKEKDAKQ
jgi:hypothetical protein